MLKVLVIIAVAASGCATTGRNSSAGPDAIAPEARAYNHFLLGVIKERSGQFEAAMTEFQHAADLLPESQDLAWRLMLYYAEEQNFARAEEMCKRLLKKHENDPGLWILLSSIQQKQNEIDAASASMQKARELKPTRIEDYGRLFDLSEKTNDWVMSIEILEKLTELQPNNANWHYLLGQTLNRIGDGEGARSSIEKALVLDSTLTDARFQLGVVLLVLDQNEAAVEQFQAYLEKLPQDARARGYLAGALSRIGRYAASADELSKLPADELNTPEIYIERVYALLRAGNAREAANLNAPAGAPVMSTLFRAIARKAAGEPYRPLLDTLDDVDGDVDTEFTEYLGSLLFLFGNQDAGEYLAGVIEEFYTEGVQSLRLDLVLGRIYLNLESYEKAESILSAAAQRAPMEKWPHYYLSTVYDELDRFKDAERHLKACLEINPEDAESMNNLGYLYAERDIKLDEAEKLLIRAIEIEPNNGYYLDSLGWIYYRRGDADKAIEYIRRAIVAMGRDDAILRDHLGDAYLLKGDLNRAVSEWQRARRLDPKLEGVQEKIDRHVAKTEKVS
ncbi:MAG: hypothetical protein AMXMBFR4_05370 [Candidatus Hydrogenedentota bacterium]